jgi:adenosine deaminase
VCASYAEHPIDRLRRAGVPVSVNTDDPALLGTALEDEYAAVGTAFAWGHQDYLQLAANSIEAAFCSPAAKASLRARLARFAAGPATAPRG